ncbi:hypothetical protein ACSNOI_24300 [Actinomadura kijaniata]|uniref:hypothetical protein n=1 Tax=Actinomadura kijaniata TaxID=46161 RepID=UPI003F1CECCB
MIMEGTRVGGIEEICVCAPSGPRGPVGRYSVRAAMARLDAPPSGTDPPHHDSNGDTLDPPAFSTRIAHWFVATWAAHHPMIVLEGCDGVGKTTLSTGYGYHLAHANRSFDDIDLAAHYTRLLTQPGPLVTNRSFISELVYGPLFRNHSRLTLTQATDLATDLAERDGLLIHLTASLDQIYARLLARDDTAPPNPSNPRPLCQRHRRPHPGCACPDLRHDPGRITPLPPSTYRLTAKLAPQKSPSHPQGDREHGEAAGVDIREAQKLVRENKATKGFNTTDANLEFNLTYGELAEAFDAFRKNPDALGEELANVFLYLASLAQMHGIDLDPAVTAKPAVNTTRTYTRLDNGTLVKDTPTNPP